MDFFVVEISVQYSAWYEQCVSCDVLHTLQNVCPKICSIGRINAKRWKFTYRICTNCDKSNKKSTKTTEISMDSFMTETKAKREILFH